MTTRAATLVAPGTIELRTFAVPDLPGEDWGWLRVEACGLCGTDVEQFEGTFTGSSWPDGPLIPGHEIVGIVEQASPETAARWGVAPGDRVAVEPTIPCGSCRACLTGAYVSCHGWPTRPLAHGFVPVSVEPSLWGGWAEMMALHPRSVLHRVPEEIDPGPATLFNALGAGFEWTVRQSGLQPGDTVLILGAGQRGLASVVAARAAGADGIVVSGRSSDLRRLSHARTLGADLAVDVDSDDLIEAVHALTAGRGVEVVVDTTAGAVEPVTQALHCVADRGTIVLAGLKGGRRADLMVDDVVLRAVRIRGVRSVGWEAYDMALRHLADDQRLDALRTHVFDLAHAADAVRLLASDDPDRVYVGLEIG